MSQKEEIFKGINNNLGNLGQEFAKDFFAQHSIPFKEASKQEDLEYGIDCYIGKDNFPTDIKNTKDIYICQIYLENGIINSRHPFKKNTKATHYCVVNVSETEKKFIELIEIKQRLLRDYISGEENLKTLYRILQKFDKQHYQTKDLFGSGAPLHLEQGCIQLKNLIKPLLKSDTYIVYPEITDDSKEISFKLTKKVEKTEHKKQVEKDIKNEDVVGGSFAVPALTSTRKVNEVSPIITIKV